MINWSDPLELAPPEIVVDLLAPRDGAFGDDDFAAFVSDLDNVREMNAWWLVLTSYGVQQFVESAEVY